MGSMINLAVGRLEIDWGKNWGFRNHSALFQEDDVANVPYYYSDDNGGVITEYKEGLSKPLHQVIERINLLGYTSNIARQEFSYLAELNHFDETEFTFDDLTEVLRNIDVNEISPDYGEGESFGKFFRREIFPKLNFEKHAKNPEYVQWNTGEGMENLTAYTIIRLLMENSTARDLNVTWAFLDVQEGGYAQRNEFVRPLDQSDRFLIVTEGSSDAKIIKRAFEILKPHIADFFDFVDMNEGYPFTGSGNLTNFTNGLMSIKVQNNVVVIYDNDATGVESYNKFAKRNIPANMRVLKLPDMKEFEAFETEGPNGKHKSNINGKGAAIECYLHLDDTAVIRWTNFNETLQLYHGALKGKKDYTKEFLKQKKKEDNYDYAKIEAVLDTIITNCISMREVVRMQEMKSSIY